MLVAVRQSADIICDRWSISVILAALLGARRFAEFSQMTEVTGSLLTTRLRRLESDGIVFRLPYSRRPLRHEYRLTNMGAQFFDVVVELARWEQRWSPAAAPPVIAWLRAVAPVRLDQPLCCRACGLEVDARDIELKVSGSLLRKMPSKASEWRRSTVSSETPGRALLGESLDLLGDKWSIEVINCAFLRIRRFSDFRAQTGMAPNILADRLARLVAAGFLRRLESERGGPARGYRLTQKGIDFYPVLIRMQEWADAWITDRVRSPVTLVHRPCGQPLQPRPEAALSG
jgi:DNA-binding HxlR family transcriptional regulator